MGRKKEKTINLTELEPEEKLKYEIAEDAQGISTWKRSLWKVPRTGISIPTCAKIVAYLAWGRTTPPN